MSPEEHYRMAELDIDKAREALSRDLDAVKYFMARAQVHATLALAVAPTVTVSPNNVKAVARQFGLGLRGGGES